jgi:ABC-type sugar transport system ATPase subunit
MILKDGKNVSELEAKHARVADIENKMVGHTFAAERYREDEQREPGGETVLTLRDLSKRGAFETLSLFT